MRSPGWVRSSAWICDFSSTESTRAVFALVESGAAFQTGGDLIQGSGWQGRPTCMPKALSFDLRSRVLAAIDAGLWCRQAAARFGVSASSAIRWQGMRRAGGDARPKPQGGDRLSRRTEAHAELIHAALAEGPDITRGPTSPCRS